MDVPMSFDVIMILSNLQFHGIYEEVSAFVKNLYSLVKKVVPTQNLQFCPLRVQAKTFVFDPVFF